jgi:hypothetical protein
MRLRTLIAMPILVAPSAAGHEKPAQQAHCDTSMVGFKTPVSVRHDPL